MQVYLHRGGEGGPEQPCKWTTTCKVGRGGVSMDMQVQVEIGRGIIFRPLDAQRADEEAKS